MTWSDATMWVLWGSFVFAAFSGRLFEAKNRRTGYIVRGLVAADGFLYFCWFGLQISGLTLAVSIVLAAWWNLGAAWLLTGSVSAGDR